MDDECLVGGGNAAKRRKIDADDDDDDDDDVSILSHGGHVKEVDVGITEYVNNSDRFSGIIKQRYSDFNVYEIDTNHAVIHMTNTTPVEENDQPIVQHDLLSETDRLKLRQVADNDSNTESIQIKVCEDKAARTAFHVLIKVEFPQLESFTQTTDDGQKIICVRKQTKSQQRRRGWWPSYRGDYTHFVLYKENKDTGDAVGLLSKFLNVKASNFAYAGNKDRRAITVQRISVYRVTADKLSQLNKILRNMRVGNFTYEKEPLRLGQLWGNRFCIVLRTVAVAQKVERRVEVELLTEKTIDNYSIHDVVLPLPGFDVTFPSYESSSWYEEILTGDDITLQMLNHRVKDYALSGSYRKIVMKPVDMTWDVLSYDDKTIPLTVTDLDRLEGKSLVLDTKGGKLAAVRLEFSLPSSCYATMALREVTKTDTSAAFQTTLND